MKKTLIAAAIPALMMASTASAVELYNDGANSVSMGGHVTALFKDVKDGDSKIDDNSGRINFGFNRDMGNGFNLEAKVEWGVDFVEQEGDLFYNRLGYIGLGHDTYGTFRVGQQWGVFGDVALAADQTIQYGNVSLYTDHTALGIARAERAATYRKGHDFGKFGKLNVGLQWQGDNTEDKMSIKDGELPSGSSTKYDDRFAYAISYELYGVTLGYTAVSGDKSVDGAKKVAADLDAMSVKYGNWNKGIYAAAVYYTADNTLGSMDNGANNGNRIEEAVGYNYALAYTLDNGLRFASTYEKVEDDNSSYVDLETLGFAVEYRIAPQVDVYTGYQFDLEDDYNESDDDNFVVGARVYF